MSAVELTDRQREIKERLDQGMGAREIAEDLGITRNAVYQQIQRLRKYGVLDPGWTPSGMQAREPGAEALARLLRATNDDSGVSAAGAMALVSELTRTRDELSSIVRRLSSIVP